MRTPTLAGLVALACLGASWGCGLEDYKTVDTAEGGDGDDGTLPGGGDVDTGFSGGSGSGGSGSGSDDGGDDERVDILIDAISPDHGITAGGESVLITGGPFDSTAAVAFAGASATVTRVSETELVVTTPATTQVGLVEVSVETTVGRGSQADAFRFWEDARGRYGLVGVVELARHTGSLWEGGMPDDSHRAEIYFSEPHLHRWYELYTPSLETCRSETATSTATLSWFDPGVETISLRPDSGSLMTLTYNGSGFVAEPASITAGGRYDLVAPGGILSSEDVAAVMDMPTDGPAVSNPPISSTSVPYVSRFHTFQWTPTGADWILIRMTVENGATEDGFESVYCAVLDDGEFDFDGSSFTTWSGNAIATVAVSSVYDQHDATLPWNQGLSSIAAMVTTVGLASSY